MQADNWADLTTFRAAIDASRTATIITDCRQPDNPIVYCNQAFLDLTGYDCDSVIGHNCRFLQGPDTNPADIAAIRQAIADERQLQIVIKNYKRDGTPFSNDLIIMPIFDKQGKLQNFIGMQQDVTRQQAYRDALEQPGNVL